VLNLPQKKKQKRLNISGIRIPRIQSDPPGNRAAEGGGQEKKKQNKEPEKKRGLHWSSRQPRTPGTTAFVTAGKREIGRKEHSMSAYKGKKEKMSLRMTGQDKPKT